MKGYEIAAYIGTGFATIATFCGVVMILVGHFFQGALVVAWNVLLVAWMQQMLDRAKSYERKA